MRKFSLFIIGIVGLFTFNKSIMAAEAPNNVILNYVDSQFSMNYDFHVVGVGSFNTADYRKYIFKDSAGKNYVGFCRMPNRSSNTKGTPFRCVKLNPYDKKDETRAKFEAGVLAILQSGATLNSSGFEVGATEAALRSFELLWGGSITKNFGTGYHTQAHALMARNFAKKNENLVREVIGSNAFRSGLVTGIVDRINGFGPGNSQTAAFQKRFDELMLIGVNAAKNFKTSTSGKSSIKWNEKAFESIFKKETDEDGNKIYKKTISYTFDIKNMNTDKDYLKLKFECPDCEKYNATYSYRVVVNNKEVSTDITEDLLKYIKNGTGKITVNIDFTVSELSYACEKIDYKLIASYYSLLNSTVGYDCRYDGVIQ